MSKKKRNITGAIMLVAVVALTMAGLAACAQNALSCKDNPDGSFTISAKDKAGGVLQHAISMDDGHVLAMRARCEEGSFSVKVSDYSGKVLYDGTPGASAGTTRVEGSRGDLTVVVTSNAATGSIDVFSEDAPPSGEAAGHSPGDLGMKGSVSSEPMRNLLEGVLDPIDGWKSAPDGAAAALGAGIEQPLVVPAMMQVGGRFLSVPEFSYVDGVAQALYDDGGVTVKIRKGTGGIAALLYGDPGDDGQEWKLEGEGASITCCGAEQGKASLVGWDGADGIRYSAAITGGDYSLSDAEVLELVGHVK